MNHTYRITAIVTGILFLITDFSAIIALQLYQPLLKNFEFITSAGVDDTQILVGTFLEILLAIANVGTAVTLYPLLKRFNSSLAISYVVGRTAEAIVIAIGVVSILTVLTLRTDFLTLGGDPAVYQALGNALLALQAWTFFLGPIIILSMNATILGYILYKTKLVPRAIALLALVDGPILFCSGTAMMFGIYGQLSTIGILLAMPMLLFEVSFALWLIVKGFNTSAIASLQ